MRQIEEWRGKGTLYVGTRVVGPVEYSLGVFASVAQLDTLHCNPPAHGLHRLVGWMDGPALSALEVGTEVRLERENGQSLSLTLMETSGAVQGRLA